MLVLGVLLLGLLVVLLHYSFASATWWYCFTTASPLQHGGTASLQLRLCNMGQVQQQGARLVTGQTPTVSVADFDGDGRAGHSCWDK